MATQILSHPQAIPTQLFDSATSCAHTDLLTRSQNDCAHAAFWLSVASYGHAASFWLGQSCVFQRSFLTRPQSFPHSFLTRPQTMASQIFDSATNYGHADFWLCHKLCTLSPLTPPQAIAITQHFDSAKAMRTQFFSFCLQSQTMPTQLFDSLTKYEHARDSAVPTWLGYKLCPRDSATNYDNPAFFFFFSYWFSRKLCSRSFLTEPQNMLTHLFDWATKYAHLSFRLSHKICSLIFSTEPQNMAMHLCDELQNMAMQIFDWTTSYGLLAKPAGNGS